FAFMGQLDELFVARDQFSQGMGIDFAEHRDQHTVLRFNGETDVYARWMNDLVANEPTRRGAVFCQSHSKGAQRIQSRAGFRVTGFAMSQKRIKTNWQRAGSQWPGPTSAHGIGDSDSHRRSLAELVLFEVGDEFFEILDGDPSSGPAPGQACQIGSVQT